MPCAVARPRRTRSAAVLAITLSLAAASPAFAARTHHRAVKHSAPVAAAASAPCANAYLVPSAGNLSLVSAATLCLINQQRAAYGLAALKRSSALTSAATAHSRDMVAADYFSHNSPSGADPLSRIRAAGYLRPGHGYSVGENIAAATGSLATPAAIVSSWMSSAGHRTNILSSAFHDTGMGVAAPAPALLGSAPGGTYTEDFGATS
jgi:uncharacterized protein YkwD